jgi:hypothetical protein
MRLLPYPTGRALFLLLVEMIFAILQLRDAQRDRLGAFARELLHVLQFPPQLLRVRSLCNEVFGKPPLRGQFSAIRTALPKSLPHRANYVSLAAFAAVKAVLIFAGVNGDAINPLCNFSSSADEATA